MFSHLVSSVPQSLKSPRVALPPLPVCATSRAHSTVDRHHCPLPHFYLFKFPSFQLASINSDSPPHATQAFVLTCSMSMQSPLCPKCLICMILVLSASYCSTLIDSLPLHSSSLPLASCLCSFILYRATLPFTFDQLPLTKPIFFHLHLSSPVLPVHPTARSLHCFSMFSATHLRTLHLSEMYIKHSVLVSEYQLIPRILSLSLCVSPSLSPSNLLLLTLSCRAIQLRESEDFDSFKTLSTRLHFYSIIIDAYFPFDTAILFLDRDCLFICSLTNPTSLAFSHARPTTSLTSGTNKWRPLKW